MRERCVVVQEVRKCFVVSQEVFQLESCGGGQTKLQRWLSSNRLGNNRRENMRKLQMFLFWYYWYFIKGSCQIQLDRMFVQMFEGWGDSKLQNEMGSNINNEPTCEMNPRLYLMITIHFEHLNTDESPNAHTIHLPRSLKALCALLHSEEAEPFLKPARVSWAVPETHTDAHKHTKIQTVPASTERWI